MSVAAEGLDALVFTAGIGERSALVRAQVCSAARLPRVSLDEDANRGAEPDAEIAAADSAVRIVVLEAREDLVAAAPREQVLGGA